MKQIKSLILTATLFVATTAQAVPLAPGDFGVTCNGCDSYVLNNGFTDNTATGYRDTGIFFNLWNTDLSNITEQNYQNHHIGKVLFTVNETVSRLYVSEDEAVLAYAGELYFEIYDEQGNAHTQTSNVSGYMHYNDVTEYDSNDINSIRVNRNVADNGYFFLDGGEQLHFTSKALGAMAGPGIDPLLAAHTGNNLFLGWLMFFIPTFNNIDGVSFAGINGDFTLQVVPEPASMLLLGSGLGALGLVRRKRKLAA